MLSECNGSCESLVSQLLLLQDEADDHPQSEKAVSEPQQKVSPLSVHVAPNPQWQASTTLVHRLKLDKVVRLFLSCASTLNMYGS